MRVWGKAVPDYPCYCGDGFFLPQRDRKSIIDGIDLFCGVTCFITYLCTFPFGKHLKDTGLVAPCVPELKELYDPVTRKWYRSWYEIYVARCLFYLGYHFDYEVWGVEVDTMMYTPDFWLKDLRLFIEVKGAWGMSSKTKFVRAGRQGYSVTLLPWYLFKGFKKVYRLYDESVTVVR